MFRVVGAPRHRRGCVRRVSTGPALLIAAVVAVLCAACGPRVDIKQSVEVTDATGGWYDAGIVDGKNKLVPSVSFRLKKKPEVDLDGVSLNVVFRRPPSPGADTEEDWDEVFIQNAKFAEADRTAPLVVRPHAGYTGDPPQSRQQILQHSGFRDVRARVFAKQSGSQWVELAAIDIPRQLLVK